MSVAKPSIQVWSPSEALAEGVAHWVDTRCRQLLKDAFIRRIDHSGLLFGSIRMNNQSSVDANEVFPDGTELTLLHAVVDFVPDKSKQSAYGTALLEYDADINKIDIRGITPFMLAARSKNIDTEMFRLILVQPNLSLELQDNQGRTALMHAVEGMRITFIKHLADLIVKKNQFSVFVLRNEEGETAEDIARRMHHPECERILCKRRLRMLEHIQKQLRHSFYRKAVKEDASVPIANVTFAHKASSQWRKFADSAKSPTMDSLPQVTVTGTSGSSAEAEMVTLTVPASSRKNARRFTSEMELTSNFLSTGPKDNNLTVDTSEQRDRSVSFDIEKIGDCRKRKEELDEARSDEGLDKALSRALGLAVRISRALSCAKTNTND